MRSKEYSVTPLPHAAANGQTEKVQELIHDGADVNVTDKYERTPLHCAAGEGHTDIVKILIQTGAHVNVKDLDLCTPLHRAIRRGHTEIVQILIQAGADTSVKDDYQITPFHDAVVGGHLEIFNILMQVEVDVSETFKSTLLHDAAAGGHTEIVQKLLYDGADVNFKDKFHQTPLPVALKGEHKKTIEMLLEAGVDINVEDKAGLHRMGKSSKKIRKVMRDFEDFMTKVPEEVRILGEPAIYKFANALRKDSMVSNVIRVMLVGHYGVGKTTIAMNLLGRTEENISSTDGIDVFINQCLYDIEKSTWHQNEHYRESLHGVKDFIRLDLTDFAGQLIYYTTHQTYLTRRGLYLLVFNLALGLEGVVDDEGLYPGRNQHKHVIDFLEYWIAMIVTYARSEQANFPKIILIGTHKDKIKDQSELRRIKGRIEENFNDFISSSQVVLRDELFISARNMSDETRNTIRNVILEEGKKYKEFGEPIPSSWIALQEKLMDLKQKNQLIVHFDEVKKINSEMNVPLDDEELKVFLKFLHNMGYILYFDLPALGDKIILDPKVVKDAMKSFITCERFVLQPWKKKQFNKMRLSGRIKMSHVRTILEKDGTQGISNHTEHLLATMKELDLICEPMIYNKGMRVSPDFYLVPCMMSADMPEVPVEEIHRDTGLTMTFSSERILPPAIFNRLVSSCLSYWEIFKGHFYNGLVILRSGKFHLMEMRRDIKQIVVTFAHTESTRHPNIQRCQGIKLFMIATMEKIVAVYSAFVGNPIRYETSEVDNLLDGTKLNDQEASDDKEKENCICREYDDRPLEDVNLMRIAQRLQGIDLSILCSALLNDAQFASQIQDDFGAFRGDVKAFYVLQKWKKTTVTRLFTVRELRHLLMTHLENANKHIICQAMQCDISDDALVSTNVLFNVYEEFLSTTSDRVTYEYMQLGLELGLKLADIERLRMENDSNILRITRAILNKWHTENKKDATFLKLAIAFHRCGERNLEWMEREFDVTKAMKTKSKTCSIS